MLNKINMKNVYYSFFIGAIISMTSRYILLKDFTLIFDAVSFFISGLLGLTIGFLVEIFTALLPLKLAKMKLFFLINNLMAIFITVIFLIVFYLSGLIQTTKPQLYKVLIIAAVIIALINFFDYLNYRATNRKLQKFQKQLNIDLENKKA